MIKSREVDRVCSMDGEERNACRILVGKCKERDHLRGQSLYGRIILKD